MREVKFHSDKNKPSLQKCYGMTTNVKKQKVNGKSKKTILYALKLFDTSVTAIFEYGIEVWGFEGLEKLGKKPYIFTNLFFLAIKQSTADNSVYGELGRRPCQIRFRWKQVKFWNIFIELPHCRLAYNILQVVLELDNNSSFVRNTKKYIKGN